MKKYLLVLFLAFFSISYGQFFYKPGYFINNEGVKTECLIKQGDWRSNPSGFKYKLQESDTTTIKTSITDVAEFGTTDVSYKRFVVKIDRKEAELRRLDYNKYPKFREETLFLKVLVTGEANLYFYMDDNILRYFYDTKTIPIEQLIFTKYLIKNDEKPNGDMATYNQFWFQLIANVNYGEAAEKEIKKMKYHRSDLEKYFRKYNAAKSL